MKKLSLAIYWHMHQPVYEIEGTYLMPWSRLHAIKDYLNSVLLLEKFPKLKLNIDIAPSLIDTLFDYENGADDIHSELSVLDTETMTDEEKAFVLNNFFSPKFDTMIVKSEHYKELFKKRFSENYRGYDDFTSQEFSDLMALFNLVWINPIHYKRYSELQSLWDKQYNYTQEDRIEIIRIHRQIISEIIPAYRKYLQSGRIEITASAYYHAILPILINMKTSLKSVITADNLPAEFKMKDYAHIQVKKALDRIEEIFGVRPSGFWPPELCVDPRTLNLLAKEGIKWTIADEVVLSNSINFDFTRDFKGNLNDPYKLLKTYCYNSKTAPIDIIFRDRTIPALLNFEYNGLNPKIAAGDLYEKIKNIQNKLVISPDETHLLTIASDEENCWENYINDGNDFLEHLYSKIEEDDSLEPVLISDYLRTDSHKKLLNKLSAGSGIDKSFKYWTGEYTKNKAWAYIKNAQDTIEEYKQNFGETENYKYACEKLMSAQGSDWFWWYGEPNNSGQDFVFDFMFREHLKNVYRAINMEPPEYLDKSLIKTIEIPFRRPSNKITPRMDGLNESNKDWENSGLISILDGPVHRENKNIEKINFGCDEENMYFRLHLNKNSGEMNFIDRINQFYIYIRNATNAGVRAYIRLISKTDNPYPILHEKFENELTLTLVKDTIYPPRLSTCLHKNMWTLANPDGVNIVYKDVIDVSVPFDSLGVQHGDTVEFFMANTDSGVKNTYLPQEILLSMTRS